MKDLDLAGGAGLFCLLLMAASVSQHEPGLMDSPPDVVPAATKGRSGISLDFALGDPRSADAIGDNRV